MTRSANEGRGYESPIVQTARNLEKVAATMTDWLSSRYDERNLRVASVELPTTSGVANETLLLRTTSAGSPSFVVRLATDRPLFANRHIYTQYFMCQTLTAEQTVPVPTPVAYEDDPEILGAPFYVTEFVEGVVPSDRPHFSEAGFVHDASPSDRRRLWENAVDALAMLHRVRSGRFDFLAGPDRDVSGLEAEMAYWRGYADALEVGPSWNHDMLEHGWTWLTANLPEPAPTALSWGDARIGNMIFRDFDVVALLDWDTVSLAGPEADLAWWIQMDRHSWELLPGLGTPDELVDRWEASTGQMAVNLHWYLVFTALRLGLTRMKLRRMMVADGVLPPPQALPGAINESIQLLALWLDVTPPEASEVRKPRVRDL